MLNTLPVMGRQTEETEQLSEKTGARLLKFRLAAKLGIVDMVERTGISRSGLQKMESTTSNPAIKSLFLYLTACDKTLGDFFEDWEPRDPKLNSTRAMRIVKKALDDPAKRGGVLAIIDLLKE